MTKPYRLPFDPVKLPIIGHFGGSVSGMAIQEPYAYIGFGSEFAVLDISDPKRIARIGYLILDGIIQDINVTGTYAFVTVAEGSDGLYILNIAQPASPIQLGFHECYWAKHIVVMGQVAYLIAYDTEVHIIDIHNPAEPTLLGKFTIDRTDHRYPRAQAITVAGNYAYLAAADLHILDVSNPLAPLEVGKYPIDKGNSIEAIRVRGPHAYLATSDSGLVILNVSNPTMPSFIGSYGSYETIGCVDNIVLVSHYAYLYTWFEFEMGYFAIVDIASPQEPRVLNQNRLRVSCLVASSRYAYRVEDCGLRILDLSDPAAPIEAGQYLAPGNADSLVLANQMAYISGGWYDFHIADVSQPDKPLGVGYFRSPNYIEQVIVMGTYAYLVEGACTLGRTHLNWLGL